MLNALPSDLERFFTDYEHHLFGVVEVNVAQWEVECWKYFDSNWQYHDRIDDLFNRFAGIWSLLYQLHQFSASDMFWDMPIDFAHRWEKDNGKLVHKGTPYYFKGMSLIRIGNIDKAFLFFHQAVEEDRRSKGAPQGSPAWKFVTLDATSQQQAAFDLVKQAVDWLELRIKNYGTNRGGALSLSSLKTNLLDQPRMEETTFSFTHATFRVIELLPLPQAFRSSQFASQLELDVLFNLARTSEVWLKDKQTLGGTTLAPQLRFFFQANGWALSQPEITALNAAPFDGALTALLDGLQGQLARIYSAPEGDLLLLYVLRNEAGHTPTASQVIEARFSELVERALFGLFAIAEKLFP